MTYIDKLHNIGITLLEPIKQVKTHHRMQCMLCGYEWSATPISKLQNFKKHGIRGCPVCSNAVKYDQIRQANVQKLNDRGLEILSDWDGTTSEGHTGTAIDVTVCNINCGHTFTSTAKNLLTRGVECPICAKQYKTNILNADSERRSAKWRRTASEWQIYKSEVTKLTRVNYNANKRIINPSNLPTGKAGTEGAYHVDHIIPIRYCFDHNVPTHVCADASNLQMLGWRESVGSRDKLKVNTVIPQIFEEYINETHGNR